MVGEVAQYAKRQSLSLSVKVKNFKIKDKVQKKIMKTINFKRKNITEN